MTRIREANKQYNIHIVHITYLSPLLKFGKRKVFTVRKLVSCDVDKVRGITIFVRKKVGGIDPTHPPGFGAYGGAAVTKGARRRRLVLCFMSAADVCMAPVNPPHSLYFLKQILCDSLAF